MEQLDFELLDSCAGGDFSGVQDAIKKGANVNAQDENGTSALNHASWNMHLEIVEFLLKKGADPNLKNNLGQVPLSGAIANNSIEIASLLVKKTDLTIVDDSGLSLLYHAVISGRFEILSLLLENGADPNFVCTQKINPEMYSMFAAMLKADAFKHREKTDRIALSESAVREIVSKKLKKISISAIEVAQNCNDSKMVALLKKFGAK